jgi:hypothetical protein
MLEEIMGCHAKNKDLECKNVRSKFLQCGVLAMETEPATETCGKILCRNAKNKRS